MMEHRIIALIQKYISSNLKSVEDCIRRYPEAKKYQPLMKTRGEMKQILKALNKSGGQTTKGASKAKNERLKKLLRKENDE